MLLTCLFALQSVISSKSWLAALEYSLLMLCKCTAGYKKKKKQMRMASRKTGETLTDEDEVTCCREASPNLVSRKDSIVQ